MGVREMAAAERHGMLPEKKHGSEGKREDWFEKLDDPDTGKARTVVKVIQPASMAHMHARGRITDKQKDAADRFADLYQVAHTDGVAAIDYSKVKVDCSSAGDSFGNDRQVRAIKDLQRVENSIGKRSYDMLVEVAGQGKSLLQVAGELAARVGRSAKMMEGHVMMTIVGALDDLDALWYTAKGTGKGIRADVGERTTNLVDTKPVDPYAHMTTAQRLEHARKVVAALERMQAKA